MHKSLSILAFVVALSAGAAHAQTEGGDATETEPAGESAAGAESTSEPR